MKYAIIWMSNEVSRYHYDLAPGFVSSRPSCI